MGWEWLIPTAMTLGGGILNQLGGTSQDDQTDDWLAKFNAANGYASTNRDINALRSNSFWDILTGGQNSYSSMINQMNNYGQQAGDLLSGATESAKRSASDIWNSFAKTQPGMMSWANAATNQAMTQNGSSMEDLAALQSSNAVRSLENMLSKSGGAMGGAQYAALAKGAAEPLLQAQTQLGLQRSNIFNQLFNNASQAGYSAEINRTNDLLNALTGAQNLGSMYGSMGSNLASILNSQAEQQILAPSLESSDNFLKLLGQGLMGAGFKGFGNMIA